MSLLHVIILAVVQGLTELLPVSSSAHVVVAEKLLGMDPSAPEMTLLLVILHTGTMFAVIVYFWNQWRTTYFRNAETLKKFSALVILATAVTAAIGEILIKAIEKFGLRGEPHADVEQLFSRLDLIAPALAVAGVLILGAGILEKRLPSPDSEDATSVSAKQAGLIGAVQALCLPFRGFSRSGATISTGMLAGMAKVDAESFSFALAVVLTPPAIARETFRLIKEGHLSLSGSVGSTVVPILTGAFCAFLAGLLALKWLGKWLEGGRWYWFGVYCLIAAAAVAALRHAGF
jgi:undecaprenyl-diphosphatase